jgi:hypothetical protein
VYTVPRGHGGVEGGLVAVQEEVDVLPDLSLLVTHPPYELRVPPFEALDHLSEGSPFDLELALPPGEVPKGRSELYQDHAQSLCGSCLPGKSMALT